MTHFVALVVADTEEEIAALVAPYDENTKVEPYFAPMSAEDEARMAEHYGFKVGDHEAALANMRNWTGRSGRIENGQVGEMSTYNPLSRWDWYVVGGRWKGIVPHNACNADEVEKYFIDHLPSTIVDADGWHSAREWGFFGVSVPSETPDIVKAKLAEHKGKRVFVVDFHI